MSTLGRRLEPAGRPLPSGTSARAKRIFLAIVLLGSLAHVYRIDAPLFDKHPFRQFDTAAIARNFYDSGMNIFYPQVDWRGTSEGFVEMEFQSYTYTVAVLYKLFGPHDWLGRALNGVFWVLSAILLFLLVKRIFDERAALFAVFFYAFTPYALFHTRTFQPDAMLALGSLAGIYFFWRWTDEERWWQLGLAWLGVTIAVLIKPPSLYLAIPLAFIGYRKYGWRVFSRPVLWGFAIAVMLPSFLWYRHAYQLWVDHGNTFGVFGTLEQRGLWSPLNPKWLSLGKRLVERLVFGMTTPLGMIFLVVGFLSTPVASGRVLLWWLIGFAVFVLLIPNGHWNHDYYQLPAAFIVAAYMGYGVTVLLDRRVFSRWVVSLILFVILLSGAYYIRPWYSIGPGDYERLAFGKRVEQLTDPEDLIVMVRPAPAESLSIAVYRHRTAQGERLYVDPVDFYNANRNGFSLHDFQATPEFVETLRQRGARFLATFFPKTLEEFPELGEALERRYTPVEVTDRWVIYRLDAPEEETEEAAAVDAAPAGSGG